MDRFKLAAFGAVAIVAATALSGCSSGQVSQMATQEPAVNGTNLNVGLIAVRNIHLRAVQTSAYIEPGTDVELLFTASNDSPDTDDKLVSITSDVGTVTLTGDTSLPANGMLVVGAPDGQVTALETVEDAQAAEATVTLTKPITNGLTYDFTFKFEKAGEGTMSVPISAGESPKRDPVQDSGQAGGHSGGH
ncbi:hypothetical protein [Mycolicibacterium sp. XJ1819]